MIHVVSGFQVAGFSHVIGCLWPADDLECEEVSKRFYSLILKQEYSFHNEVASALQAGKPLSHDDVPDEFRRLANEDERQWEEREQKERERTQGGER
jgi:hypothetical protein